MQFTTFWADVLSNLLGGAIFAFLFFLLREKFFGIPNIAGRWHFQMTTEHTAYNPYKGMVLRYVAVLWRDGNRLAGTVEKIYENSVNGEREFDGNNRTRGTLEGYYQKRYFGKDEIYIHIVEDGHGRESTHYFDLRSSERDKLAGTFFSMVADQDGSTTWQREPF